MSKRLQQLYNEKRNKEQLNLIRLNKEHESLVKALDSYGDFTTHLYESNTDVPDLVDKFITSLQEKDNTLYSLFTAMEEILEDTAKDLRREANKQN